MTNEQATTTPPVRAGIPPTRAEISRANSVAHSTGPRTEQGKNISRYNGTKHGLAGQRLIMADDELEDFQKMNRAFHHDLAPEGATEISLVETIVFANWQLARARAYENNLLTEGARRFTDPSDPTRDFEAEHTHGITRTFDENLKQLDTVSRYTTRFHRQILQAEERLRKLQFDRETAAEYRRQERDRKAEERRLERQLRDQESFVNEQRNIMFRNAAQRAQAKQDQATHPQRATSVSERKPQNNTSVSEEAQISRFAPQSTDSTNPTSALKPKTIHEIAVESRNNSAKKEQKPAA